MASVYKIIDPGTGFCVNAALWDGKEEWNPGEGLVAVISDEIKIGDAVILNNGVWEKQTE